MKRQKSRNPPSSSKLKNLGVFRLSDAKQAGISQPTLSRLVAKGEITRLGQGLYIHPKTPLNAKEWDYAKACTKFGPKSVIGGMTALFYYNLIEQVPHQIWIIIPKAKQTRLSLYRVIRSNRDTNIGIENHGAYRITNLERTLVEGIRYSGKWGIRTAIRAIQVSLREKRTTIGKIMKMARALDLENCIAKYGEILIGAQEAAAA